MAFCLVEGVVWKRQIWNYITGVPTLGQRLVRLGPLARYRELVCPVGRLFIRQSRFDSCRIASKLGQQAAKGPGVGSE